MQGKYWVNNHAHVLGVGDDYSLRWLYYALLSAQVRSLVSGSVQPKLSMGSLRRLPLPVPGYHEQEAIVSVLEAFDDKIESNRRLAIRSEKVWLRVATRALTAGEEVPVAQLIEEGVLAIGDGYRAKNSELRSEGAPFLRAANLTGLGVRIGDADLLPFTALEQVGPKRSRPGDTVFTSKGTVGRITFLGRESEPMIYSPQVCFWRSNDPGRLSPHVLHAWMRSPRFVSQVNAVKGQTDMADYVSLRDQRAMVFDLPEPRAQREVDVVAAPLARQAEVARAEAHTLTGIRDALLPKLISGRIRIPLSDDVEEQVGVAAEALT